MDLQKLRNCHCDPAVSSAPECPRKVILLLKAPAVIPQPRGPVTKIFVVQQKLVLRLRLHFVILQNPPHIGQKQHRHIQCVIPQFLLVYAVRGLVLETALLCPGEGFHDLSGRLHAGPHVFFLPGVLRQEGHGQIRRRGVDVQRREPDPDLPVIIFLQGIQIDFLLLIAEQLP